MEKRLNGDPFVRYLINEAIPKHKEFAFCRIVELWNGSPTLRECAQGRSSFEDLLENLKGPGLESLERCTQ
jgi:hypothetical protein